MVEDVSEDRLLEILEEALASRVIEELPQSVGRYHFTHALIQETLAEELSITRRVRLHARIAQALEELYGDQTDAHAAELAHHFAQAEAVVGTKKLVHYSLVAGERALATYAHEDALAHFQRGLTSKGVSLTGSEPAEDVDTADMLKGLGRAQAATVERQAIHEAVITMTRAFDYYVEVGAADQAVEVAQYPFYPVIGQPIGVAHLIARAIELTPPDTPVAGRLLSRYGRVVGLEESDYQAAQQAFAQALTIAGREGDVVLEMITLADAANVDLLHELYQQSVEKSSLAIEMAGRVHDLYAEALARHTAVLGRFALGDFQGGQLDASELLSVADQIGDRFWLGMACRANQDAAHLLGNWHTARDYSDRALAVSPMEPRVVCTRAMLEYESGDFSQGQSYLERLIDLMELTPSGPVLEHAHSALVIPAVARISGNLDWDGIAEAAAQRVLSSRNATPWVTGCGRIGLALLSVQRTDVAGAQLQYGALKAFSGMKWPFIHMVADRLLGLLAQNMGNMDQATAHFEDALEFCRKAGYRPELAWTCCDYADALLQRGGDDDRLKAMSLLDESLAISRDLGMRPLMERALSRRVILRA